MLRSFDPQVLALLVSLAVCVGAVACTDTDEPGTTQPELRADESEMQTVTLAFAVPEGLAPDELEAIAGAAERLAGGETAGAKVLAEQADDGAMSLSIQIWGPELAPPEAIVTQLRAEHPALAQVEIATELAAGVPADEPMIEPDPDETPEEIRARITDELRAQGVEGEITVDVSDDGEGRRRVEVHVDDAKP